MRTKTLLLTAALGAAGMAATVAQDAVFSVNAVGYVNTTVADGFSIIANPLNNGDNTLDAVISGMSTGTTVFKFDGTAFSSSSFVDGVGWLPNLSAAPGEGFFIQSAGEQTITFVGEVPQGDLSNEVPAGLSIKASQVPQAADLASIGFPATTGDNVFFFRNGGYAGSSFVEGLGFIPEAIPAVGEGFFVQSANGGSWDRTFSVND